MGNVSSLRELNAFSPACYKLQASFTILRSKKTLVITFVHMLANHRTAAMFASIYGAHFLFYMGSITSTTTKREHQGGFNWLITFFGLKLHLPLVVSPTDF